MQPVVLAIDQGTTNTKVLLLDEAGAVVAQASRPMALHHPRPDWTEQSAEAIWDSVAGAIAEAVAGAPEYAVVAIAISNQRETVVLWDAETGRPVGPAVSWQCRRSSEACAQLRDAGHASAVQAKTGLALDPMFSAGKLGWLVRNLPAGQNPSTLRAGTVDSWLLWNLTGGAAHATDHGNASRTQLFDIHRLRWDPDLAALFGVPLAVLPDVRPSDSLFGATAAGRTALPAGVPIHAMMGDSHAALFAHGVRNAGAAKVTIGTGSSIMTPAERPPVSRNGLSSTIAWSQGGRVVYGLEGNITVSGQVAAFAADMLGLPDAHALTELARGVDGSDGVVFVPALAGLGAPHWQDRARGAISGLTMSTGPAHIARAALEAIALQIADVVRAMQADLGVPLAGISADGGATRNDFLMQLLADLLDLPVARLALAEASAIGAAQLAAAGIGWTPAASGSSASDRFAPAMDALDRARIVTAWTNAVRRVDPDL